MKLILSLAILLVSTASFANDRICLVQNGVYFADFAVEIYNASSGSTKILDLISVPVGKRVCTKKYFPEKGDIATVVTKHMVFYGVYHDTCPVFKTNESVKVEIWGTTLNAYCNVQKCEDVGCSELLEN